MQALRTCIAERCKNCYWNDTTVTGHHKIRTAWTSTQFLVKDHCVYAYVCHLRMPSAMTILHCLQNVDVKINSDSVANFEFQWNGSWWCYFHPITYSSQHLHAPLHVGLTIKQSHSQTVQQWPHAFTIIIQLTAHAGSYILYHSVHENNSKFNIKFIYFQWNITRSIT